MNEQKHIINRQVLELTIPERVRAQSIQNRISEIVRQKLNPALDVAFSKMAGSDEIIRIDQLVIDIGTIAENELENEFVEMALNEIRDKINGLIKSGTKTEKHAPVNGKPLEISSGLTSLTKSKNVLDKFMFFLQFGHFPWWHIPSEKNAIPETNKLDDIFIEILKYDRIILKNTLFPLLKKQSVRQRLVNQFSHSQLNSLLSKIDDELFESYYALYKIVLLYTSSAALINSFTESFYKIALEYFSIEKELKSDVQKIGFVKDIIDLVLSKKIADNEKENLLSKMLRTVQHQQQIPLRGDYLLVLTTVVQVVTELHSASRSLKDIIKNMPERNEPRFKNMIENFILKTEKDSPKVVDREEKFNKDIENQTQVSGMEPSDKSLSLFPPQSASGAEEIGVFNAGLVLIHPFLKYFFEGLNLLDKELQFKSKSDAFKAVHLLQFIVTGNETAPETDLPLNKILCGIDYAEPVPRNVEISEEEKQECLFLINTVQERWEVLKTTNPAALRETFLQREGILKPAGQSWNLTIGRTTFDIMLERLPWSISLIKLPWCEQILYVEW